jgi:hypothetical protein
VLPVAKWKALDPGVARVDVILLSVKLGVILACRSGRFGVSGAMGFLA